MNKHNSASFGAFYLFITYFTFLFMYSFIFFCQFRENQYKAHVFLFFLDIDFIFKYNAYVIITFIVFENKINVQYWLHILTLSI